MINVPGARNGSLLDVFYLREKIVIIFIRFKIQLQCQDSFALPCFLPVLKESKFTSKVLSTEFLFHFGVSVCFIPSNLSYRQNCLKGPRTTKHSLKFSNFTLLWINWVVLRLFCMCSKPSIFKV